MKTKVGIVCLQGGGDTEVAVVSEETINWVTSPKPEDIRLGGPSSCMDPNVPPAVLARLREDPEFGDEGVEVCINSYENDRAIWAYGIPIYLDGEPAQFESVRAALSFCRKRKLEVVDTYTGHIY